MVYHERFREVYSSDPAAQPGRIESIYDVLHGHFDFVKPDPASAEDLKLVHGESHINHVKSLGLAYEIAKLAVGGAIKAAELAFGGESAFGLIRPPGHHASRDSSWGFCYFNNIAIAIEKLRHRGAISKALIVDFDLHFGDGTAGIFSSTPEVSYFHLGVGLETLSSFLAAMRDYEIIALSAGFDRHEEDWGGMLKTEDYQAIGSMIKEHAGKNCGGRCFAVLEGGYNTRVLGRNVKALLDGLGEA